jgi:hypothetical protein
MLNQVQRFGQYRTVKSNSKSVRCFPKAGINGA